MLTELFAKVWNREVFFKDWLIGLIFKIPKREDLSNCGNWQGMTSQSIPSKVSVEYFSK